MRTRTSARLGADFTRLWTASAVSTIGDGVTVVAGPLLVASLTRDPVLVAGAAFVQSLSSLLFSLAGGVLADRLDRRRLIVVVDVVRAAALGGLCAALVTGTVNLPLVYVVFALLGACETIADTAAVARLPAIVAPERLATANARLMATFTVGNQFVAKPLGAWLFAGAAALPFGVDALSFVAGSVLVAGMRSVPAGPRPHRTLRGDLAEGVHRLWSAPLLRCLALSVGTANVAFCGAFAVFVLYARERLGLSGIGYGLLLTTFAVGGLAGTAVAGRLQAWFGATWVLRAGLVVEALTHLTLAITRRPWLAGAILVVFGVHTMVWGVIATTLRQRTVPDRLLGRVAGVQTLIEAGGATIGMLLGGVFARSLGITAPFWIACGLTILVAATAWGPLGGASATGAEG